MDATTLTVAAQSMALVIVTVLVLWVLFQLFLLGAESLGDWLSLRRQRRIARFEAELDAKSEQLRDTILAIAGQLADAREQTSQAMHRAALDAAKKAPPRS